MPQIKLLIDNQVVYESTDPTSIKSILKKNRVTMEEDRRQVAMEDLTPVTNPIEGQNYYYVSRKDDKIYEGKLEQVMTITMTNSKIYQINTGNGNEIVNTVYVKKTNIGGKRRQSKSNKKTRRTRKTRKTLK
jgi:hypothetical protein